MICYVHGGTAVYVSSNGSNAAMATHLNIIQPEARISEKNTAAAFVNAAASFLLAKPLYVLTGRDELAAHSLQL